jgi:transcriptional regulator with XRE-family HTH domain
MLETGAQPDAEHEFDIRVGERLRALRRAARLTQTALGNRIGVTFQQVQKYENGSNRMSASRLWLVALFSAITTIVTPRGQRLMRHDFWTPGD